MDKILDKSLQHLSDIFTQAPRALVLCVIGYIVCQIIFKAVKKAMALSPIDATVQSFVQQLLRWILYIALFLGVVQNLGISVSSFVGILTAAGVATGLALQGSLSNFAGGIMLLLLKPFSIGDSIEIQGKSGVVRRIGMFYTAITEYGNQETLIPNGPLFAGNITNYSKHPNRRLSLIISVSYNTNLSQAKELLQQVAQKAPYTLSEQPIVVYVEELADSDIRLSLRVWVKNSELLIAKSYYLENIKQTFEENGIEIPFPQRDMNIKITPQEISNMKKNNTLWQKY